MDVEWKKRPFGSEARQKRSRSLDVPSFMSPFLISINTETNRVEVCGCEEQLCALLPVPQSSHPLLCYWSPNFTETDESVQRSFGGGDGGGEFKGHCTYSELDPDPLTGGTSTEIPTNTDTVTKQLCGGAVVKFSFYLFYVFIFSH